MTTSTTSTTSTTLNQSNSRLPSQRDFEIFRLAVIKGFTHKELAGLFEVSRRRISQIVENVKSWLSQHPCEDPNIATELQNKRLAQHLERMHLEEIINQARQEVSFGKRELLTTTEKADGTKTRTYREQPFNVQVLKTYLRAIEALGRLNARPEIPLPPPPEGAFPWIETVINETYEKWYSKIWSKRLKPDLVCDFIDDIAAEMLKAARHQQELSARTPDEAAEEIPGGDIPGAVGNALCGVLRAASDLAEEIPLPPGEGGDRRSPGEGQPARSAVGNALCGVPCASSDDAAGPGYPDPAEPPTAGLPLESTEYSVPSTPEQVQSPASTLDLGPGTLDCPSTASLTSLPEAPAAQQPASDPEGVTSSGLDTSTSPPATETDAGSAPPSPENPKREAPPPSLSPSLCPTVSPSPSP